MALQEEQACESDVVSASFKDEAAPEGAEQALALQEVLLTSLCDGYRAEAAKINGKMDLLFKLGLDFARSLEPAGLTATEAYFKMRELQSEFEPPDDDPYWLDAVSE